MEFHGSSMEFHGAPWKLHGIPWSFMGFHGNHKDFRGVPWKLHGNPWSPLNSHGILVEFHGSLLNFIVWHIMKFENKRVSYPLPIIIQNDNSVFFMCEDIIILTVQLPISDFWGLSNWTRSEAKWPFWKSEDFLNHQLLYFAQNYKLSNLGNNWLLEWDSVS